MPILDLIQSSPKLSIIVMASAISLFITIINYFFLDKDRMREIKSRQKTLQKEMKQHQKDGNHSKVMELQKEMLSYTGEMMKHSFKPMLITIIPIILFFSFIRNAYEPTSLAGSWFWWYLVSAIVSSMVFRKLFRLP